MTRWLAATALLLALGGCGDDGAEPAPVPVPATTSSVTTPTRALATESTTAGPAPTGRPRPARKAPAARTAAGPDAFVATVRDKLPGIVLDRRDEEISAIADQACTDLADGEDADDVVARTRSLGTADAGATDQATARELIKLAIDTVCPDQDRRVDEF